MHWPSDNEWWQIIVFSGLFLIWETMRECRNHLKRIADALEERKRKT